MPSSIDDIEFLQAAIVGLRYHASEIDRKMAELRARIGGGQSPTVPERAKPAGKRALTAVARRRIAAAQRKRWAAYRKQEKTSVPVQKAAPSKPAAKKRRLSPAAKKRISEANKRRWAAFRAAKATATKKAGPARKSVPAKKRRGGVKAKTSVSTKIAAVPATPADVSVVPGKTTS